METENPGTSFTKNLRVGDVTATHECGGGYSIATTVVGLAYPRSGNAHMPTPRKRFNVTLDGKAIGSASTLRGARELVALDRLARRGQ